MKIQFFCKKCGQKYIVDEKYAGKKAKCKKCDNVIQVPNNNIHSVKSETTNNFKKDKNQTVLYIISMSLIFIIYAIIDVFFVEKIYWFHPPWFKGMKLLFRGH